jgi:SAM-dependent methyltransferase
MKFKGDPIGCAIHEYIQDQRELDIIVESDLCEDDVLPIPYLFRTINEMPDIEKFALAQCEGNILDIGAGAGCHSLFLKSEGFNVTAIDQSVGASSYLNSKGIKCHQIDFNSYQGDRFKTILLLMNGIGLAGTLDNLPHVLNHLKKLILPQGKILCDSTDILYMFTQDDGSLLVDLNANYYGEMNFNMHYKNIESGWFPWLYIDPNKLIEIASEVGFEAEIILEGENNHYLAELKIK